MSEMIERVARAICIASGHPDPDLRFPSGEPIWTNWTREARAAIEAMREPTEEMVEAPTDDVEVTVIWQAMIDAALSLEGERG